MKIEKTFDLLNSEGPVIKIERIQGNWHYKFHGSRHHHITTIKEILPIFDLPPNPPVEEEPIKIEPIKEEPIKIILPPDPIIKIEPIKEEPIKEDPIKTPIADVPPYTGGGSAGGGGGGSSDYFERGGGYGREQVFERDMNQRENIQ
jgi:hypothetical protein